MSDVDILGLYRGIERYAMRLETRPVYAVSWEDDQLAAWRLGEQPPPSHEVEASLAVIREITSSGRRIARVRFLEFPVSEYMQYEFEVAYPANARAGEEILVFDRRLHPELDDVTEDFVSFDGETVVWYRYDEAGHLTGYDYSDDPTTAATCRMIAQRALELAVPFTEFSLGTE